MMKKNAYLFILLILMVACKGQSDNDNYAEEKHSDAIEQAQDSQENLPAIESATRIYQSDGLKYRVTILLDISKNGSFIGKVTSVDYVFLEDDDDENYHTSLIEGEIKGNKLSVVFEDDPPIVGDKSIWTDHDWEIKIIEGVETLVIPFDAMNYETDEWSITYYEFPMFEKL